MKKLLVTAFCLTLSLTATRVQAQPYQTTQYLFEYSGTVRTVGGTVVDGSLLPFVEGDTVSGSFVLTLDSRQTPPPGTLSAQYPLSIESFLFGSIAAVGAGNSAFGVDAPSGSVGASKQVEVGTGSIYDNFAFSLSAGVGNSPFSDVASLDLTTLNLADFSLNHIFSLERVDIASNPLRVTEVVATLRTLKVTALPPITFVSTQYLFEYSGTVRTVGGTVVDGSLLPFVDGDTVSGSFVYISDSRQTPPPGTLSAQYPLSIESFLFGSIAAVGGGYSVFGLEATSGNVGAYKQVEVGTGSIYDTFQFDLSAGVGNSPFSDVASLDLTTLNLADFPDYHIFSLDRVDLAFSPVHFTEVVATLRSLKVTALPNMIAVSIEIKPGSRVPTINLASPGVIPVAILSSPTFDAIQVDPASVSLSGAKVMQVGNAGRYACSSQDVNGDGQLDLLCNVKTASLLLEQGDLVATLQATTFDGQAVLGQEAIRIVP